MKAIISRTVNGAWMRIVSPNEPTPLRHRDSSHVFDAYKHDGDDMSGLVSMLYDMLDEMGWVGSRHDRERVQVRVIHGDKFAHTDDDKTEDCHICKENM